MPLSGDKVPIICLRDELEAEGFTGVRTFVMHTRTSGTIFDLRDPPPKRSYLQCVLASSAFFAKSNLKFASNRPQSYYKLLLRSNGRVPDNASDKKYKELLSDLFGDNPKTQAELNRRTRGPQATGRKNHVR